MIRPMRKVEAKEISEKVKDLFLEANFHIGKDVLAALEKALEAETSKVGQDVLKMKGEELQNLRSKEVAMIFQDPTAALNPVFTIGLLYPA